MSVTRCECLRNLPSQRFMLKVFDDNNNTLIKSKELRVSARRKMAAQGKIFSPAQDLCVVIKNDFHLQGYKGAREVVVYPRIPKSDERINLIKTKTSNSWICNSSDKYLLTNVICWLLMAKVELIRCFMLFITRLDHGIQSCRRC